MTISTLRSFDVASSINELLRDHPSAILVLNAYGIDSCCGGNLSIPDAARRAGVSLDSLLGDIEQTLRQGVR